ncbi:MAG: WecB/TagA/CpsF family glycosyltransferase [Candidatus Eremiobacteraeota bacterium]|nr:WecB/TagA/CpsF family glycosyltransferase [Candidatus Eremiobacteraeota bacterium]
MTSVTVLGCRVDVLDARAAVARVLELARGSQPSLVVTLGTEMIVRARSDRAFRDAVNASALSLCDTIGVVLAARLQVAPVRERVAGVDLIDPLCAAFANAGIAVYLLGARGDTAERAANALRARHPGLVVAGARDGFFGTDDDAAVADAVRASGANVLFAGLGSPRQELWIASHLVRTGCSVGIGVGGSFDVLAGNVPRAPEIWRRFNLEWLYRLVREPARWRRQLALPYFVWLALCERATSPPSRRLT